MEAEASLVLFRRSLGHDVLLYTTNGDDGTHQALCQDNVYGLFPIVKEECMNHVSKRMGSVLFGLVDKNKTHRPMGGKRHLTRDLTTRLTFHSGNCSGRSCLRFNAGSAKSACKLSELDLKLGEITVIRAREEDALRLKKARARKQLRRKGAERNTNSADYCPGGFEMANSDT